MWNWILDGAASENADMAKHVSETPATQMLKANKVVFTEHPYEETEKLLETTSFIQDAYSQGIPVTETVYALILMRRHIWLYADLQSLFYSEGDIYQAVISINRVLVVFDYAIFILASKYGK